MSDESKSIDQDEVERLLSQAQRAGAEAAQSSQPAPPPKSSPEESSGGALDQSAVEALLAQSAGSRPVPSQVGPTTLSDDMEEMLDHAEQALAAADAPAGALPPGVKPFELRNLTARAPSSDSATLDLLRDVQLDLKIELGRTHMHLEEVLQLKKGAVVTLDKLAGDPVDIYVNGRLIARGEVLVLNDNFCVRVAELVVGDSALR